MNYSWPGNVRQLENAMIFAVSMSKDRIIIPADLPDDVTDYTSSYDSIQAEETDEMMNNRNKLSMKELEKMAIAMALQESGNQVREAAEKLNLSKSTLYRKIREYRILDI
jgi:DNA-binding NtrC family response regulator